ncbi:hypothetical protein DOK67_0001465 [Enterococcus sp. DIV0212c]|uniref:MucBP domain-containing protein n=1 Tax=Enterococcus sp. DIV0212c TaxID=2230867 RepID=UPI001A9BDC09|nr:MucBP domain-containing protein [Enterococcus sp. DIV0212c]MBO1354328.1 MucBP domain-containing protein [Enterococcus sp. DIV0212c]
MFNRKKKSNCFKNKWLKYFIGVLLLGTVLFILSFKTTVPILANSKNDVEKSATKMIDNPSKRTKNKPDKRSILKALDPVENESGLKVTPKALILKQNANFPNLDYESGLKVLFSERVIPHPESGVQYKYVNADGSPISPSSEQVGFQKIYVEVTENYSHTSIRVPIPVTIYDAETTFLLQKQVALQIDQTIDKIVLYPGDTADKTEEQLKQVVKTKANIHSWNVEDGTEVPVNVIKTTISSVSVGRYTAEIEVTIGFGTEQQKESIQKEVIVFGADRQTFLSLYHNNNNITNPTFPFFRYQTMTDMNASSARFQIVNENGDVLERFDTGTVGFHWAYVKMTDVRYKNITTIIKVPINITSKETTDLLNQKIMVKSNEKIVLYPDEIKGKSKKELITMIQSRTHLSAWDTQTGASVAATFNDTTVVNDSPVGSYTGTIKVELNGQTATTNRTVILFGADLKQPYYFTVDQYKEFIMGLDARFIFSRYQSVNNSASDRSTYEWVKNKAGDPTEPINTFNSSQPGFHWGYIKMTDKTHQDVSTVIPIPITVTADKQTVTTVTLESKVGMSFSSPILYSEDIKGKTAEQINQLVTQRISPKAWELTSGKDLDVRVTESNITNSSRGSKEATLTVTFEELLLTYKINVMVLPEKVFGDSGIEGWENIPLNSTNGVITNPINGSKIGFPRRGVSSYYQDNEIGFIVNDSAGRGYVYRDGLGKVSDIPGVNSKALYTSNINEWRRESGIGWDGVVSAIPSRLFLRKENMLKQILVDDTNQILYVYNLSLSRNLNFTIRLDMYNLSNTTKKFSMLESVDTDYYNDYVPIYSLGNNSGFYMQPSPDKRFTIKLKDAQGNWFSDYTKYIVGPYYSSNGADTGVSRGTNYFRSAFTADGLENKNHEADQIIVSGVDSAYQLGAPWKNIEPDEALKTGYEIFAGDELPYMQIKAKPEVFNVYSDYAKDFKTSYKLSKIPTENDYGTIYVTYPNGKEIETPFTSNSKKEFDSSLTISRDELPEQLNEKSGTILNYDTSLLAINEAEGPMKGLPSDQYVVSIAVYNLGAKPIPQIIKKGTAFTKKASEIIQDPVILPEHAASYEYEGEMPDTSTVGLTSVMVRMTDVDEPDKTTLIKIPVQVIDETPPIKGLYLFATNFNSGPELFQNLTQIEVNKLILEKSEAIAWDMATGSSKDVNLSVESTTLTPNPEKGSYKATLKAEKDTETIKKTITIDIQSNQKVNIEFVDETGTSLHEKVTFDKPIGTTIDLTKEKEVQQILQMILDKNYQLVKKPENETKVPVTGEESTVQYQFKGMLFVQSSPNFLNFGRKSLGLPFIKVEKAKYDKPLIVWDNRKNGGAWDLTATLKKPLTSQEDPSKILPSAIRYKISDTETVILSKNITQSIAERTHETKGQYNVSDEWDKNESGMFLEVPSGEVLQPGGYRATILWQVEQTP